MSRDPVKHCNRTRKYRKRHRDNGAVIVYAMITSPEAVEAWKQLREVYGTNRDTIEAALIDCYEALKENT